MVKMTERWIERRGVKKDDGLDAIVQALLVDA